MIGDVLTSSILAQAIKTTYPHAQVDYLINSHTFPVVENNPYIDNFLFFTPEMEKGILPLFKFLKKVRRQRYSHVIDVYAKLSSNLISLFSGAHVKISYHKKEKTFLYTHNIHRLNSPQRNASLAVENRMRLLEPLGVEFMDLQPKIYLEAQEKNHALQLLKDSGINIEDPLYMISVLGSSPEKSYPSSYMAALLDFIVENSPSAQIIFNYSPSQKDIAETILKTTLPQTQKNIFFQVYASNLRELLAITSWCNAVIGNEGGLINMAKALAVPTFIIFSPYLDKKNWFGAKESKRHTAVHLSDFLPYGEKDWQEAKKYPELWYSKFKPSFLEPLLLKFLRKTNGI